MKYLFIVLFVFLFFQSEMYTQEQKKEKKTSGKASGSAKKKQGKTFVDLEGLDIQGLIDRPQTLYILKRSKVDFHDSIESYDYIEAIVAPTYKEPF